MALREEIRERITNAPRGTVFTTKDFLDLGPYESVRKILPWMAKDAEIRRIIQGIYDRPYYSELLRETRAPDIAQVAKALARSFNWTIAPSGATALNLLGLTTQVPAHYEYISDGPYRKYDIDGITLSFAHRNNRSISSLSPKTVLVIEALKFLGKDHVDDAVVRALSLALNSEEMSKALIEAKQTSQWIYDVMRKVTAIHANKDN